MTTEQHDSAYWRRRAEHAESDAAALRVALGRLLMFVASNRYMSDADRTLISDTMTSDRPGARLLAELEAARLALEEIRARPNGPSARLLAAIFADYDAAVEARAQ